MRPVLKKIATGAFLAGDRLGVHVLPSHYYSPVASRRGLRGSEEQWRRPLSPIPFDWDLDAQESWLIAQVAAYPAELPLEQIYRESEAVGGFRYGPIEAQFLYSYLRTHQPARVVEVGSGSSTLVMSRAVERNLADGGRVTEIVACDPYTADRVAGLPHVRARAIGGLDVDEEVLSLQSGDVWFIDSTHAVRTGSELAHLYLELLPQLRPGVVVHIHDICLPYLYAPDIFQSMFDWQETTLVAALLVGNPRLRVLACMSALHHDRPEILRNVFPEYRSRAMRTGVDTSSGGHFPSSLWLQSC